MRSRCSLGQLSLLIIDCLGFNSKSKKTKLKENSKIKILKEKRKLK